MSKHTPGPWGCVDTSNHAHDYRLTQPNGQPLTVNPEANDHSEQRANARLIAAAPELLEALKMAVSALERSDYIQMDGDSFDVVDVAREVIFKATGGTQ